MTLPQFPRVEGTHIYFAFAAMSESGKTVIYDVNTKGESAVWLGSVRWFGRWRCYVFEPLRDTVYEKTCLREIADFCEKLTNEHNAQLRERRKNRTTKVRA